MRGRSCARASILIASVVFGSRGGTVRAQESHEAPPDSEHYQLRGELGVEYDSNAHRVEQVAGSTAAVVGSVLERFVVSGQGIGQVAPDHAIMWSATAAGKVFDAPAARSENVAIAQSSLAWRTKVGPRTGLAPSVIYYEAFQSWAPQYDPAGERRDFRSLAPTAELRMGLGESVELGATGGYRWLLFKPDRDYDFNGPTAGVNLHWLHDAETGSDWEARAGVALEHRGFGGPALVGNCGADHLPCPSLTIRTDQFVMAQADVTRTGRVLLSAGYAFHYNDSNSYGETVTRHIAIARVAGALPLGLYLAARADLLFAFYRDVVPVALMTGGRPFVNIEDENRSSARVDLSRDIGDNLRALLRYTFYANELGNSAGTYRRHTLLLSLAFVVEK